MKTRTHILSLGMAAALVGAVILPTPQAQAGNDKALIAVGALIGGLLGYIASESDTRCGQVAVHGGVGYAYPAPVIVHRPVVVHPRPVVVVLPYRPYPPRPAVVYTSRHTRTYHPAPRKHGYDRRPNTNHGRR